MPIPAPTPAIPGELTRLSVPGASVAEGERSCAVRLKAAADIVRAPVGGVVAEALEGGNGDGVRGTRGGLADRGEFVAGYSGGVPYVFKDVTDKADDPKLMFRVGLFALGVEAPGRVVVLSDAGAETLRRSNLDDDGPRPSSSGGIADRGG